jgi:microcystin degradation protein MlrC
MGPVFQRVTTVAAAATSQPLQAAPAWQHRFLGQNSAIEYDLQSTTVNDTYNISLGSSTEVQESNVPGGGTVGLFRAFNDNAKAIVGAANDELAVTITFAAAASAMIEIHLTAL